MKIKKYQKESVLQASIDRISKSFDTFKKLYVSFSGGKDSTVMLHLVLQEAKKRGVKVGVLIIDLEAQYQDTIKHIEKTVIEYSDNIDLHWVCGEMLLRNAVSNYDPRWICWDESKKDIWVRQKPKLASNLNQYNFYLPKMEFEEFMVLWGQWYSNGDLTGGFIGIRSDESLHRYRAIASDKTGLMMNDWKWTTKLDKSLYNVYPIYDWKTKDIWIFHGKFPELSHNAIYDKMNMAGVKLADQRLCQPYGDDQRKGLWLYHILEPETWYKVLLRVNGANSGALYMQETGNMTGYNKITKPENHTWQSFCNMLLSTLPKKTQLHYKERFKKFIAGWQNRGYKTIPDEAPINLENICWVPSWRRMCKVILRNDYWCKGLGQTQPKSDAYIQFKDIKKKRQMEKSFKEPELIEDEIINLDDQLKLF